MNRSEQTRYPPDFIPRMRKVGNMAARVLEFIEPHIRVGVSTETLDSLCAQYIEDVLQAKSACLNYHGYPKYTCISVNEVVCHGIPSEHVRLKLGDILNIDVTVVHDGVYGDTSKMFLVGNVSQADRQLCQVTQAALYRAIQCVKPGMKLNAIGACIEALAIRHGYSVVRDFCGHFIGTEFHQLPNVLHYFSPDDGFTLSAGMTFTIEPMLNQGTHEVKLMRDGWTVKTKDRKKSAQYEHTILVTESGFEVLTLRSEEMPFTGELRD